MPALTDFNVVLCQEICIPMRNKHIYKTFKLLEIGARMKENLET